MKQVRLIEMCLNETYGKVRIGKHLSDIFPIKIGLKQGNALLSLFLNFALEYAIRKARTLINASKEVGLEASTQKTKYMLLSCH
jgi:hypothetical protein